jgi:voltage-gated potassium channel
MLSMAQDLSGERRSRTQRPAFAIALLGSVIAGGTIGYVLLEDWGPWDAFYMTVITVTTVGYREVHPLSRAGQAFTIALLLSGVGAALYTFSLLASAVVEGLMPGRLQKRRQAHMIESIRDHFIVCGYGRIGRIVAHELRRQQIPFIVIERDPARVQAAVEDGVLALEADASREDVLNRAAIARARGLIAAVGTDAENVYAVLSARVLRPDLFIVGRAETEDSVRKLQRAGANRVISPYQIGAVQMAQTAIRPAVVDFVELATSSENLELAMEEITVSAASTLASRSILEANLRQRFGVIVVAIQREDRRMEFNPEPDTGIRAGDKLVVLGRPHSLKRLESEAAP